MLSRIPQHKNDSIPASINSTSISPPCENIEPESLVPNYTSTTAESNNTRTDLSSGHNRTGGDAPVCIPKTRRRKRIERPKTIDLGSMSDREQLLLSLQQRKVFSSSMTPSDPIWPYTTNHFSIFTDLSFDFKVNIWYYGEMNAEMNFISFHTANFGSPIFFARITLVMNDLYWDDPIKKFVVDLLDRLEGNFWSFGILDNRISFLLYLTYRGRDLTVPIWYSDWKIKTSDDSSSISNATHTTATTGQM